MNDDDEERPWADLATMAAVEAATATGMPYHSLAVHARWWQLETWLRELVYIELRAKHGATWDAVAAKASGRLVQDAAFSHMESADSKNPLAYLDYSQLLEIVADQWDLFSRTLLERRSWDGRQEDLKRVRHRVGHMRVPHADDLGRVEQVLRDLERGAYLALWSYNTQFSTSGSSDTMTSAWIDGRHPDAQRLLDHAYRQYNTRLHVRASRRPWAGEVPIEDHAPGVLWHANFYASGRTIDAAALWRDVVQSSAHPVLVHVLAHDPSRMSFTFSAADEAAVVADAIGEVFDAILMNSHAGITHVDDWESWGRRARQVDFRVLHSTRWNIVDETTIPISLFGAGAGVQELPSR